MTTTKNMYKSLHLRFSKLCCFNSERLKKNEANSNKPNHTQHHKLTK